MTANGTQPEDSPTNLYGERVPMNFIVTRHYHTGPFADMILQSPTRVDFRPFIGQEIEAIYTKDRYTVVMVEEVTA